MNQHYVPEFYLKNFSRNSKQIFVFDKEIQKSFPASISSVASQKSFYDNSNNQSLEDAIGKVESKVGSILKILIDLLNNNQFARIDKEHKTILIQFIWLQMNRTLESRIQFGSIEPLLLSKLSNIPFDINVNDILSKPEVTNNHIEHLSSSAGNLFAFEMLNSSNFIIVKNETQTDFLASDEPVVRYLHRKIDFRVNEIFLPITPKFGIWIFPKNIFKELDDANEILYSLSDEQNIMFYNFLQVYHSTRQIFSFTDSFDYIRQIFLEAPNFGNLNKKRWE